MLQHFSVNDWEHNFSSAQQQHAITHLEQGQILFFPTLSFNLLEEEKFFLNPIYADPHNKNICYHPEQHKLWGVQRLTDKQRLKLKSMMDRFSHYSYKLVRRLLPIYNQHLIIARTSFRPIEIMDRKTSFRKDDTRLHIDAFPSAPCQGKRILRVFCNINPNGEDRVWRVGEPFSEIVDRFAPNIKKPTKVTPAILRLLRITKSYRSPYDHYMLNMHDNMKSDRNYQSKANHQELRFPPGSTWIVQTDHVAHAVVQGQYALEQTFYLPIEAMHNIEQSPLKMLEKKLNQVLI